MNLSDKQHELIDQIAKENNLSGYEVHVTRGSSKGDNFMGIILAVTLKSKTKTLELILKSAETNETFRKSTPVEKAYARETYVYKYVFEEFKKFQDDNNIISPFNSFAKVYGFSLKDREECLILENLKTAGYQLWNKKNLMNPEHTKAVIKEYAKFHAVSLAMKHISPGHFNELVNTIAQNPFDETPVDEEKLVCFIEHVMKSAFKSVEDDRILTKCLEKMKSDIKDFYINVLNDKKYKDVVIHGDCWCNNILFKYKDPENTTTPSSLRIIDWQLSCLSSPAYDFSYFFLIHSTKDILNDYKTFVDIYYDTLYNQLINFQCDPTEIFSYSKLEEHLKVFMKYGLFISFVVTKIMMCDTDDVPDLIELSEKDGDISSAMSFDIKNFEIYKNRITDLIKFAKDNHFI